MQGPDPLAAQCAASFQAASQRQQDQMLTPSTNASFELLDLKAQCMSDFKAFFDDSVRRQVVKHIRRRHALLPIGMLPTELLQDIFSLLLFTRRGRRKSGFARTITDLRGVSWSWRELLERTPTFWTHISSEDGIEFVSEALKRSDQAPLHLKHIGKNGDGAESPFLDQVLPHSHRWESVTIHHPNNDVAARYFNASAPIIKLLLLSIAPVPQPGGLGGLFGGVLENLEELRIASCGSVDWKDLSCVGLRTLDIEGGYSLDMRIMFNILAANPKLQVLRLHKLTFAEYVHPSPTLPSIHLQDLQELALKNIKYVTPDGDYGTDVPIVHILQRIRFRPGTAFTMREYLYTNESLVKPEELMSLIPNPVEALVSLYRVDGLQIPEVQAAFEGDRLQLEIKAGPRSKPTYSVEVHGMPQSVAKNWVVGSLREVTTPVNLRVRFRDSHPSISLSEVFIFQLWESVVDLGLDGNFLPPPEFGRSFLRLLSTHCASEDGSLVMPFPKLQHLRLTGLSGIKARDMLAMVRARFASPAIPTGAAYRDAPVPMTIHLGNGVGGWRNKVMDDILATPGVKEVRDSYEDLAGIGSSSSSSSESEWPPPYNYFVDGEFNWTESEGSLQDWDEEVDVDIDWGEEVDAEDIGGEEVDAEDIDMNF